MKAVLTFLLWILVTLSQGNSNRNSNVSPQTPCEIQLGSWRSPSDSKEGQFPRYFICGAEMTYFRYTQPYSCKITQPKNLILTTCTGGLPIWDRTNGIRFKYCNFEDWDDQKSQQFYGSWEWMGMRMCPKNQYVYGYSTKINPQDGLNGLVLHCRNKYTNEMSNVTVREGKGTNVSIDSTRPQ
jgi:hypothetical protein